MQGNQTFVSIYFLCRYAFPSVLLLHFVIFIILEGKSVVCDTHACDSITIDNGITGLATLRVLHTDVTLYA